MLCDGRLLDGKDPKFAALFAAIRFGWGRNGVSGFNLPDLRGYFLRGVFGPDVEGEPKRNPGIDPDHDNREPGPNGGNGGNKVGSLQAGATARPTDPNRPFVTDFTGSHNHILADVESTASRDVGDTFNTMAARSGVRGTPAVSTDREGGHSHVIQDGGDLETRPVNAYVHWIIRYAPSGVGPFSGTFSTTPTQAEMQAFASYVEQLRAAVVRGG